MPYINDEMRGRQHICPDEVQASSLEDRVSYLIDHIQYEFSEDEVEGVCNYTISRIVAGAMRPPTGWRYCWASRAHEAFIAAGAEFYRRVLAPYEVVCIEKNGDIEEYK